MEGDFNLLHAIDGDFNVIDDIDFIRLPKKYIRDATNPLEFYSNKEFKKRYRFEKQTIINCVMPLINWPEFINNRGLSLPPILLLLSTLRFYSTSSFQVSRFIIYYQ